MPAHVFISYARGDRSYVDRLAQRLSDAGFGVWYDRSAELGRSLTGRVRAALDASDAVIVVLSPEAVASKWVLHEISYAEQRAIPLVPLLLADCDKPVELANVPHHDVRGERMVDSDFLASLSRQTGHTPDPAEPDRRVPLIPGRGRGRVLAAAAIAFLAVAGLGTYLVLRETGPRVIVTKGTPCGEGMGATQRCAGAGYCLYLACAYIHVETVGFEGPVTCQFFTDTPSVVASWRQNEPWGPNESKDSGNWFGLSGRQVTVTCDGVSGSITWS